jgi:hypothetical protein
MWISESASTMISEAEPVMRGRPHVYSDALIQALLTLKQVYHLTLRAALGFAQSLRELAFADLPVPNYDRRKSLWDTTLSRRAQDLRLTLPAASSGEPLHLVVDGTGVKLDGEGEWKVRKHGYGIDTVSDRSLAELSEQFGVARKGSVRSSLERYENSSEKVSRTS